VRSHGGRIMASNAAGGGLIMTVVLPRPVGTAAVPANVRDGVSDGHPIGVTTEPIAIPDPAGMASDGQRDPNPGPASEAQHRPHTVVDADTDRSAPAGSALPAESLGARNIGET
jgi:hypothetical protein